MDAIGSKINLLFQSNHNDLTHTELEQLRRLLVLEIIADVFFCSAAATCGFAVLDLAKIEITDSLSEMKQNTGLIKSGCFMVAQLMMYGTHSYENKTSENTQAKMSKTRSIVYDNTGETRQYSTDFFWSSMFFNLLLMSYSIATKFESCNGPLGPNGEQTCMSNNLGHHILNGLQIIFNIWLAATFLRKGVENVSNEFVWANKANVKLYELLLLVSFNRVKNENKTNVFVEETKENIDEFNV